MELLLEHDPEELIKNGAVEPCYEAVLLQTANLRPAVFDVIQVKIELIEVAIRPTVIAAVIGEYRLNLDALLFVEG